MKEDRPAPTLESFLMWLRRDLTYIEGVADGVGSTLLKERVNAIRHNINEIEEIVSNKPTT